MNEPIALELGFVLELWPLIEPALLPDCGLLEGMLPVPDVGLVADWLLDDCPAGELLLVVLDGVVLLWLDCVLLDGELCVAWLLLLLAGALGVVVSCATAQAAETSRTAVKRIFFRMR